MISLFPSHDPSIGFPVTIEEANDALKAALGYNIEELKSMNFQDVTHPDDIEKDRDEFNRMINKEINHYTMLKRYIKKDGSYLSARLWVWIFMGKVVGCFLPT